MNDEIRKNLLPHFVGHSYQDINCWIEGKKEIRYGKEATALWRIMLDVQTIKKNNILFDLNLWLGKILNLCANIFYMKNLFVI